MDYANLSEALEPLAKNENPVANIKDDAARARLAVAARAVSLKLEMPFDTYFRLIFTEMSTGFALAGAELGLWKAIAAKSPNTVSTSELAKELGMLESTLGRLLRFAASQYVIDEVAEDTFRANNITRHYTAPPAESVLFLANSKAVRVGTALPEFFTSHKMDEMDYGRLLLWNLANNTKIAVWEWLVENPHEQGAFNDFMFVQATGLAGFAEKFPLEEYLNVDDQTDRIQFVDVGGGSGHISRVVLEKFPSLRGKIAVEDREDAGTVTHTDFAKEGLQRIPYDFFTKQPLKGTKAYYMRNILNNWPTDKCKIILERVRDALAPDSVILVDDIVVPLKGAHWYTTHMDLMMLTNLGAVERTEKQFEELFDSVGLKLEKLVRYNSFEPAIQAVVRK